MAQNSAAYVLGGTDIERQRLLAQIEGLEPQARWLLDEIGIEPGSRAIDIGCGPLGIVNLLSERVGPGGTVVGLEREPRFAAMAESEIARRNLQNVEIVQADATATGLPKESFDLAHERLVLVNVPEREAFISEMLSLVRPGGVVALEDIDNVSWLCEPAHPSWDVLYKTFHAAFHAGGGDGFIGRRLVNYLRAAGLENIKFKIHVDIVPRGYRHTHLLALIESLHDKIIALGLLTEQELLQHKTTLAQHLQNPETVVMDKLLVQAWGRKPR
jgi:ubiquinone/menaquinone biosynthesis C-methylase UbiE